MKSKALPKCIRIGAYTIPVEMNDTLLRDNGCCGRYVPCKKLIEIDPNMALDMQWGTLYHEVIEAITEIYAIHPLAENHGAIDILGEVLHDALRTNGKELLPT